MNVENLFLLDTYLQQLENAKHFSDTPLDVESMKTYFFNVLKSDDKKINKAKVYYGIGLSYIHEKDYPLSIQYFTKGINQLRIEKDHSCLLEAQLLIYESLSYLHLNIPHKHEELFKEGIELLQKNNEKEELVKAYIKKCRIIFNNKDYHQQIEMYIEEILHILRNEHFSEMAAYYLNVGFFYLYGVDNVMFAIVYFLKSLDLSKQHNQFDVEVITRVRLSYCYKLIDHHEEVIEYLEPIINHELFHSISNINQFTVAESLVTAYTHLGNKEKATKYLCYIRNLNEITDTKILKQLQGVLIWLQTNVDLTFKSRNPYDLLKSIQEGKTIYSTYNNNFIYMYFDMNLSITEGSIYYELKDYKNAIFHFNQALHYALNYNRQKHIAILYKHLADSYEKECDYLRSLQYYRLYNDIMEEWFQTHSIQYTESLHHKYDMRYKENQIHELNTLKEKLLIDKNTDRLTKVGNRYMLQDILSYHEEHQDMGPFAVLMIDIDYFKKYNDYYGHVKGDDVIRQVAIGLKNSCNRSTDIIIRYGGEEFLVIVHFTNEFQVKTISEQIIRNIEFLDIPHYHSSFGHVTVSIGASYAIDSSSKHIETLINEADQALYSSKLNGRNCYSIFEHH